MSILEKIIAHKKQEVAERKTLFPTELLERSVFFHTPCVSLLKYLKEKNKSGIIAEFKRRSPSKGAINAYADVEQVTIGYMQAGASALSVLTDGEFFGGKFDDLRTARKFNFCPILQKDFVVEEYQIIEAKSIGADAILLIAACLSKQEVAHLSKFARSLGLQVLLEIHEASELDFYTENVQIVGVNNRNLSDFTVNVEQSFRLLPQLPPAAAKFSESGINSPVTAAQLLAAGFDGLLIGENFMKNSRPELACLEFIEQL